MTSRRWWPLLAVLLLPAPAPACTIPVFRYALENWKPSEYQVVVFHRGELTADEQLVLRQVAEEHAATGNLAVKVVDLDGEMEERSRTLWERQPSGVALPWVVLRYSEADDKAPDVWAGPLERERLASVIDSPGRRKVVEQIGRGASAVFVLLESGDADADRQAEDLLNKE